MAPCVCLLEKCLRNTSEQQKRRIYQSVVLTITFLVHLVFCMSKRAYPLVKSTLSTNCSWPSVMQGGCKPWAPFTGLASDLQVFGWIDFTYLVTFSCSLFVAGYLAKFFDLRKILFIGMILNGTAFVLFGLIRVLKIHYLSVFFGVMIVMGITASTILPPVIEISGAWSSRKHSGFFYGMWSFSKMIGNIVGNVVLGSVIEYNWKWAFFLPAALMFFLSMFVFFFLVPHPSDVGIQISKSEVKDEQGNENGGLVGTQDTKVAQNSASETIESSSIIEFVVCNFLIHVILNILYYWLPYLIYWRIHSVSISAYTSSIFDIGSSVGAVSMGLSYDLVNTPALLTCVFLVSSMPVTFYFGIATSTSSLLFLMFLSGCLLHGPVIIIVTSIAQRKSRYAGGIALSYAIFEGVGNLGASFGPLLTGYLRNKGHWDRNVALLGLACYLAATLVMIRQCYVELRMSWSTLGGNGEKADESVKLLDTMENDEDEEDEEQEEKFA